jgi:hypothetical protein
MKIKRDEDIDLIEKINTVKIIEHSDGMKNKYSISIFYYNKDGAVHNRNGPAKIWLVNGIKEYFINGYRSREDGPAVEYSDREKRWYLNGKLLTEEDWKIEVEKLKKYRLDLK